MSVPEPVRSVERASMRRSSFDLTKEANVMIKIFDFAGEPVATLADELVR